MTARRGRGASAYATSYDTADWRERAACGDATPAEQNAMTGGYGGNGHNLAPATDTARKYCDHCPVRQQCYIWASGEDHFMGVAAGFFFGFETGRHYRSEHRRIVKL